MHSSIAYNMSHFGEGTDDIRLSDDEEEKREMYNRMADEEYIIRSRGLRYNEEMFNQRGSNGSNGSNGKLLIDL